MRQFAINLGGGGGAGITSLAFDPTGTTTPGPRPLFDDCAYSTNAAPQGDFAWERYASGAGAVHASVAPLSSETNRYGIHQYTPSTSASVAGGVYSNSALNTYPGGMGLDFAYAIQVGKVADGTDDWVFAGGFQNSVSIIPTDGIFFIFDRSVSANWLARCRAASTNTTVDTGVAVSTSWTNFRMVVNSTWTSVNFRINGTSVATIVTNIPTAAVCGAQLYMYRVAGTNATTNFKRDWTYLNYTIGSARGAF